MKINEVIQERRQDFYKSGDERLKENTPRSDRAGIKMTGKDALERKGRSKIQYWRIRSRRNYSERSCGRQR